jgi:transposase
MSETSPAYPSDVSDDEWAFVAPYLALLPEDSGQRVHDLRRVFNGLHSIVKTGGQWRYMPHDFPPWAAVYQQARRWVAAKVFEHMADDLRMILRVATGRQANPSATILDGRTMQSTPESGGRAGYDGYKKKNGSKVHLAVDTLGHLLALKVTAASEQERAPVFELCEGVQQATGQGVTVAFADQGYTGDPPAADATNHGIELVVVKPAEGKEKGAKKGFVLLPKRWVVERTFGWLGRFRRLARDYERLAETLAGWHWVAAVVLLLKRLAELLAESS